MAKLLGLILWESYVREITSNICAKMLYGGKFGNAQTRSKEICKGKFFVIIVA
jgi:hypothetical protein